MQLLFLKIYNYEITDQKEEQDRFPQNCTMLCQELKNSSRLPRLITSLCGLTGHLEWLHTESHGTFQT